MMGLMSEIHPKTMTEVSGRFELLDSCGISSHVQELFSGVFWEDRGGRLVADYRDMSGNAVDREIHGVGTHKLSSKGILSFSPGPAENVRMLFISDAVKHMVSMVQCKMGRLDFTYAGFLAIGAKMDKGLLMSGISRFPSRIKLYTVFGHSLVGRIRDCKVQHWVKGSDCQYGVANDKVTAIYKGNEYVMALSEFSLRNHLRQLGVRQTVSTCKPFNKNIVNYNLFNYL